MKELAENSQLCMELSKKQNTEERKELLDNGSEFKTGAMGGSD